MREPQNKKKQKLKYWEIQVVLDSLRLVYKEYDRDNASHRIDVPLFGIRFRVLGFSPPAGADAGWDIIPIDLEKLQANAKYFVDDLMWLLIEKGYMAYIRENEYGGNERVFKNIIISGGWGQKIMVRRIEMCKDEPKHRFMKARMTEFMKLPIPRILSHYPSFFDYLI